MPQEFLRGKPSAEYQNRLETVRHQPVEIPRVRRFILSEQRAETDFFDALHSSNRWSSSDRKTMLNEAVGRKILVDTMNEHLKDSYKLSHPAGQKIEDYIEQNNTWENSVIIERSWMPQERRFVRMAPKDEFRRVKHSRLAFIVRDETIQKGEQATLSVAGAGVGSAFAFLWGLTCGENIRIADGGVLNEHNFNRFLFSDTGRMGDNLAVILTEKLYEADPYLNITCIPQNLGPKGKEGTYPIENFLAGDKVIGADEIDNPEMKGIFRQIAATGIVDPQTDTIIRVPVLMGSDLYKGGKIAFATDRDPILDRLTPQVRRLIANPEPVDFATMTDIVIDVFIGHEGPPEHIEPLVKARDAGLGYWPQSGISAFTMAAASVNTVLDYLEGRKIPAERSVKLW